MPEAAYAAVPALPAALAVTHASNGELSFARLVGPGIALAKKVAEGRRGVLDRIARRGALALTDPELGEEIVAAAGRLQGGLVTLEDLAQVRPTAQDCAVERRGARSAALAPFRPSAEEAQVLRQRPSVATHVVAAADGRGRVAIACYERSEEGVPIAALELLAPRTAAPVRRGETRVRPGEPRPAPSPVALLASDGVLGAAAGFAGPDGEDVLARLLETFFGGLPVEAAVPEGRTAVGVVRTPTGARAL